MENSREIYFIAALNEFTSTEMNELADFWWSHYEVNPKIAEGELLECLLRAGGIKIDMNASITKEYIMHLEINKDILIFENLFYKNFGIFLKSILQHDSWHFFKEKRLINRILNAISAFVYSNHNSLRAVSYITGLKIMCEVFHCENLITTRTPTFEDIPFFKLTGQIFARSFRDMDVELRKIPILEMIIWFKELPQPILIYIFGTYFKYINRSLFDLKPVRIITLELVELAFMILHEEVQFSKKFIELKSLISCNCLAKNKKMHHKSLQILNNFFRCGYGLQFKEESLVCASIYDYDEKVVKEAMVYINNKFLHNKTGKELLLEIFLLYTLCVVKKPKIFIDRLIDHLVTLDWANWVSGILDCPEVQKDYACVLFYEFSHKIIHEEVNSDMEQSLQVVNVLKENFTKEILSHWFDLVENFDQNLRCLVHLVKVSQFFGKAQVSEELYKDIITYILKLFEEKEDKTDLHECMEVLKEMPEAITKVNYCFRSVTDSFLKSFGESDEELDLNTYKLIMLMKNFVFDIESLWDTLLNLIENGDSNIQVSIIFPLYFIVINMKLSYVKRKVENNIDDFDNFVVVRGIKNRVEFLLNYLLQCFDSEGPVRAKALHVFGQIIKNFGSHLSHDFVIHQLNCGGIIEENLELYVTLCAKLLRQNCDISREECCSALKLCCELITENKLSLSYLEYFVPYLNEKKKEHSLHVVCVMENLINKNSKLIQAISAIFFNGLIRLFEFKTSENEIDRTHNQNSSLEIFGFLQKYSFIPKKSAFTTNLLSFMEAFKNETGYTPFNETYEFIKNTLNK